MGDNLSYTSVGTNLQITQVTAGKYFSCALLYNRRTESRTPIMKCWGNNAFGQLGYGDTTQRGDGGGEMGDNLPIINLGTNLSPTLIVAGDFHNCAILDDNSTTDEETHVKCWGYNTSGQLGYGNEDNLGDDTTEMGDNLSYVNLGSNVKVKSLDANGSHTCAIIDNTSTTLEEGLLKCWGKTNTDSLD